MKDVAQTRPEVHMAKLLAVLPPSERLAEQTAMIQGLMAGHEAVIVTSDGDIDAHLPDADVIVPGGRGTLVRA
jgi:hypothetical protein